MVLLEWNTDFQLDIEQLDEQKKLFIKYVNNFDENFHNNNTKEDMLSFVDDLILFSENHFTLEEEEMQKKNYLRLQYHLQSHNSIKLFLENFKENLTNENIKDPIKDLKHFYTMWLTQHIAGEDKHFKNFLHSKDEFKNRKVMGLRCEVFTLHNHLIGEGKLKKNKDNKLYIAVKSAEAIPADGNEIVKLIIYKNKKDIILFFGRVLTSDLDFFVVSGPRVEYLEERREAVRITTFLDAKIYYGEKLISANILDMSQSGILLEENKFLNLSGNVLIKVYIETEQMTIPCYIVRSFRQRDYSMKYGCKFLFTSHQQEAWIAQYMVDRLAAKRIAIK